MTDKVHHIPTPAECQKAITDHFQKMITAPVSHEAGALAAAPAANSNPLVNFFVQWFLPILPFLIQMTAPLIRTNTKLMAILQQSYFLIGQILGNPPGPTSGG